MRSILTPSTILFLLVFGGHLSAQPAIGEWRDHFQYRHTFAVVSAGNDLYCATTTSVFKYSPQLGETERYSKINALNDVNIQAIGWNEEHGTLLIGYRNGNLDLLHNGATINMPDIKRSSMVGDKGIYTITTQDGLSYLGCGFGIVVVDLQRKEVRDTWLIGPNAAPLQVNDIAFHGDSIYAGTQAGIYVASRQAANLAAYTSWHKRTDLPGPDGPISALMFFHDRLVVARSGPAGQDTIHYHDGSWHVFEGPSGELVRNMHVSEDGQTLIVTSRNGVLEYGADWEDVGYAFDVVEGDLNPRDAIRTGPETLWIASNGRGLVRHHHYYDYEFIHPNGPENNTVYRMAASKGTVYATTGGVAGNWTNLFRKDGVHYLIDGRWNSANRSNDPLFDTGGNNYGEALNDVMSVQIDPDDPLHVYVSSWDDGILEMRNGRGTGFFDANNSTLQRWQNGGTDNIPTRIGGLAFDAKGNLWATNSGCNKPISVRMKNGTWYSFGMGNALGAEALLSDIIAARNGYKWVVRPRGQGLLVFDDNGTPSQPGDDQAKALNTFEGEGKLPSMDVFSVAEDLDGQIWVGTGKGIAVFYNPDLIFTNSNSDAHQILIEQDGNVQILLETESVSAIVVDGANRKWLGTQTSGLYLVSPDGTQEVAHFTAENSPLPSNNIVCLAMDEASGELFIGTDLGIVSYRGDAVAGQRTADCATVFPNPVRENFAGPVAITGLVRGSDIRITDVAGNLVYHTISKGGQAIWPVTDMNGQRVSTGVYLVLAMSPDGSEKCNTKVAVVR